MKTIEDYVWFYYKKGLSIIPLGKNKDNNLKAPSLDSWDKYKTERASEAEIKAWLKDGLFVGIGIIGGAVSDNLAIIDFDDAKIPDEIGLKFDKIMERGNWIAQTGKGWHIYCKGLEPVRTRKAAIVSMDLKANKGYVAAPPSPHESGRPYKWLNKELGEIPKEEVMKKFDQIVSLIKKKRKIKPPKAKKTDTEDNTPACIAIMEKGAERGRRNETLYALANYHRHIKNNTYNNAYSILKVWNDELEYPLDENELETTIKSAWEADYTTGCSSIRDLGYCPFDDESQCPFKTGGGEADALLKKWKVQQGKRISYTNLAKLIINEYNYNFLVVRDESTDKKTIYSYKDGYYHRNGQDQIRKLVTKYLDSKATQKAKDEVIGAIIDMSDSEDRSEVEPNRKYVNVENGIIDIKTMKLIPHSEDYRFLQKIPIPYIPKAKCPKILKFIKEVVADRYVPVVQEMFGYCLYRDYPISAAFILHGTGRNGKSVMLKLLREMVGKKNLCSRKLHEIADDVFAKADLYGRMVNVCGEMDDSVIKQTGNFKELTGGDFVTAQRKYHGSFQFSNYAKLIFSTNVVPKCTDKTFGFYDRLRVIKFTKIFNANNPKTNSHLFEDISDEHEMQGLLVWSLEGLRRLLKNNKISGEETLADMGTQYEHAVKYVWEWFEDNIAYDQNKTSFITVIDAYERFNYWCNKNDEPGVSIQEFGGKLRGFCIARGWGKGSRKTINGKKITVYPSLQWSDESEDVKHDEPEGTMAQIADMCPCTLKELVSEFGESDVEHLKEQGILIKLPNGKWDLDV